MNGRNETPLDVLRATVRRCIAQGDPIVTEMRSVPMRPAMRRGFPGEWEVGLCSELTGDWKETVATYSNRGHAIARYRGMLRSPRK